MMLRLIWHMNNFAAGTLKLLSATTDLFHVLALLLVLHYLPFLALLTADLILLLLDDEVLVLLRVGEVAFVLEVQVHALQPLVIHLIYLLVNVLVLV